MDPNTGRLYSSLDDARKANVKHPIEMFGDEKSIRAVSNAVKRDHRRKVKAKRDANKARRRG